MASQREAVEWTVEGLIEEVAGWEGITVGEHRFGGTEFRVGPREIGYDHARWLLRLSSLSHVAIAKKTPAGAEELAGIDVDTEVERST